MLTEQEYAYINNVRDNKDNNTTYFEFVSINNLERVNLLPRVLINIINE